MIVKWHDTPLRNVVTKSNIIRVVGILLNGRRQRYGLSRADASASPVSGHRAGYDPFYRHPQVLPQKIHIAVRAALTQ